MFGVIIGLDIKDYSQTERTDEMQEKRNILNKIITDSTKDNEIFMKKETIDTGDGGYILIDTSNYEKVLKGVEKIKENADFNKTIRFRAILHIGKYSKSQKMFSELDKDNDSGFVGEGINSAARYLDSECLKELLKNNPTTNFVFGISNEFYKQVYDQKYYNKEQFIKYGFKVKNYNNLIFLNIYNIKTIPNIEKIVPNNEFKLTDDFYLFLNQSDFVYQNQTKKSDFNTFFIFPDFIAEKPEFSKTYKASSEDVINTFIKIPSNIVIAGEDQCGKTTLCKKYYNLIYNTTHYLPIYIKFNVNEKGSLENKINEAIHHQYGRNRDSLFDDRISIILLDDFHLLDNIDQRKHIDYIINRKNTYVIIIVDSLFNGSIEKRKLTESFKSYSICEFGHILRKKIIEKWIDFNCLTNDNYCSLDDLSEYVENTFVKGIIPFTPFYILTVLAARSDFVPLNGDLTSKGHCYQALIYISLRKINIPESEIGAFLNIISNISYKFYIDNIMSFTESELLSFLSEYSERYNIPFENKHFIKMISKSSVFYKNSIGQYTFYAQYFYHYFVSKYLADHISDKNIISHIEKIYNNLQIPSNAYIGIFLVHHSKDIRLIEEVLINTMILYDKYEEINLTKEEMRHVDDYANKLNSEVIEEYDRSEEKRRYLLAVKDESRDKEINEEDTKESNEIKKELEYLKKAIRTIEVIGHILKNHSGEIERKHLKDCFLNALNAYRRICNRFILDFKKSENNFIEYVVDRLHQLKENSLSRQELGDFAHRIFTFFNLSILYATIKRSADALGSKGMMKIIKEITDEINNPFTYCVYLQCEMWYNKGLPIEEAIKKYKDFPVSVQHVIQRLLKEYTDLHHIKHKEKQQIASAFNMKIDSLNYDYEK